ncbi:unnamed protein product [Polarella glacialis]|uniref:Uncharacterized protein n=1 Tax=Polarella glacialis TaxID=89957 RepID=A0A813FII2_POLGL|nr:unnamed protein product [Polarella glacialis]
MSMLVHGGDDGCVLMVDSYTAETEPQSLLMHWTCEITFISGYQRRSLSVPAVVYSSRQEETLVQCWLDPRAWLDASEDFEALTVLLKPVRAELRPLWTVEEVPLCFRPRPLKRKRLAFCSRPKFGLWDQDSKSMLRQWMRYHHFLGVEHFYLYDNDGSVEGALPWELKDSITYTSHWPKYFGRNYADILSGSYTCDQAHRTADGRCQVNGSPNKKYDAMLSIPAYTHCLFHARGLVDFLAIAHSVDTYLGTFGSLQNIHSHPLMEAVRASKETQNLALVAVSMLRYGGPVQTVNQSTSRAGFPSVAIAFQHHEPEPMCSQAFMEFRPVRYMCENPEPLMVPEQILATTGEHWPVGRPGTLHVDCNFTVLHFKHYNSMSMIFKQFGYYNTIGLRQHCQTCVVEDKSMLWAEDLLREWANA